MAMKDAYSTQEMSQITGVSVKSVLARAERECWQFRLRSGRGGGKEWLVASMPEATRIQIAKAVAESSVPALPVSGNDVVIPDWANTIGLARFRLVMEWRERCAKSKQTKSMGIFPSKPCTAGTPYCVTTTTTIKRCATGAERGRAEGRRGLGRSDGKRNPLS